jgi:hypothetical protein
VAGQAQTSSTNVQLAAGSVGGGSGTLAVSNEHSSTVTDSSSASASSGNSVALAPTVGPGTPLPAGVTTAASGNSSAVGVVAQNTVGNTTVGGVQVGGQNQAAVNLTSRSSVTVTDTSATEAQSGQAWAMAEGAAGSPSGVSTPVVGTAASGTPGAVTATGLVSSNTLASAIVSTVTVPTANATPHPVAISADQTVNVKAGGAAVASSSAVSSTAAASGTPNAAAQSGSADAQGLAAQNTVNTTAAVSVHVGGENFAPIQVIVDSVARIFNWGAASSTSGSATASNAATGAAGSGGGSATSGSTQATGAQIQNNVDLRASAAVKVAGDNHNPITIALNLTANLINWGIGLAQSGDAQGGGQGGSATSGVSSASGLQVSNLVNMWADAAVDIEGNNYAPITIYIRFGTNIENYGAADARSGNVAAGSGGAATASITQPTTGGTAAGAASGTSTGAAGTVGTASHARGGDSVAIANSVNSVVSSRQLSSANGSHPIASAAVTSMLRNLPSGSWNPIVERSLPADKAQAVEAGLASTSGDTLASGMHSTVVQSNSQLVACQDPDRACLARNSANLAITVRDNPAPAVGGPSVDSNTGCACVNATPTPTPTATPRATTNSTSNSTNSSSSKSSSSRRVSASSRTSTRVVATELSAYGHIVMADLFGDWPGRRLPPMPDQRNRQPAGANVVASLDAWPGADELPLPEPQQQAAAAPASPAGGKQLRRPPAARLPDAALADESVPLLGLIDVDLFNQWPAVSALPLPPQHVQRAASTVPSEVAVQSEPTQPSEPASSGGGPEIPVAIALVLLSGALAAHRWGRAALHARFLAGQRLTRTVTAFIRMTLGLLRLW